MTAAGTDPTPAPSGAETPANAPAFVPDRTADAALREIARLTRERDEARTELTTLQRRVQELEGQVDNTKQQELEQRLAALEAERDSLRSENETLKGNAARAEQLAALAGKVRDPEAALRLLTDDLKDDKGNPDVEKLLGRYAFLAPDGATTPTAPSGGGGPQSGAVTNLESAVASRDTAAINAAFEAELKGASQ